MKITQEKLPASQIGLEIEITPELSQKTYDKVIKEFTRSASIPGFRKGKVPRTILLQRLGSERIKGAVLEELIQDSLKQAIEQESIEALGNYKLRSEFEELVHNINQGKRLHLKRPLMFLLQ
jgi:trigger factor